MNTEKKRLKNEMKQTQIDEKKAQLSMLTQQGQQPPPGPTPPAGGDNSMMMVAAVVGVIFIAGIGWVMMKKKPSPAKLPALAIAA